MLSSEYLKTKYWEDRAFSFLIITIVFNLVIAGPIASYFNIKAALWFGTFLFLMCALLFIPSIISNSLSSRKNMIVLIIFFLMVTMFICTPGVELKKSAFKDYIIMSIAVLYVLSIKLNEDKSRLIYHIVLTVSVLQFPFILQQYFIESRVSSSGREFDWDLISGTFGFNPQGGGGNSAGFVLFQVFFVVITLKKWLVKGVAKIELLALTLAFCSFFIAETKVVIFLAIFAVLSLFSVRELLSPIRLIIIFSALIGFVFLVLSSYNNNSEINGNDSSIEEYISKTYEDYFVEDVINIETAEVSRISALRIWYQVQQDESWQIESYIGHGLTSSKLSNSHAPDAISNGSLINFASTQLVTYLWDIGIIGVIIFYACLISIIISAINKSYSGNNDYYRYMMSGSKFVLLSCLFFPLYSMTLHSSTASQIVVVLAIMFTLGRWENGKS